MLDIRNSFFVTAVFSIGLAMAGCSEQASKTEGPREKTVAKTKSSAEPAKKKVSSIVFIGQKEACDCTRNRIEGSWKALEAANSSSPKLPVERIDRDVQAKAAEKYTEMKALMVVPGIYCLDAKGALIELLQGEVTKDKIAKLLH